jgi:hypothetical protein
VVSAGMIDLNCWGDTSSAAALASKMVCAFSCFR